MNVKFEKHECKFNFLYAFYLNMKQCFPDTCLVYSQSILFIYSYFDLYHIRRYHMSVSYLILLNM